MSQERSSLVEAIFHRDRDAALLAIQHGANLNEVYAGMPLIQLAAYDGSKDVLRILIESGATVSADALSVLGEIDMTDWKIDTPEKVQNYAEIARLLIAAGALPTIVAYDGRSLSEYYAGDFYTPIRNALRSAPAHSQNIENDRKNIEL